MNLDPKDPDELYALYNALLFGATPLAPKGRVTSDNMSAKYYRRGECALREYRARIGAIAAALARYAAEDDA